MSSSPNWIRPADESLLDFLGREGPERLPFVASRTGTHLKYAETRCDELERRGLVRRLDDGRYALTERGRRRDFDSQSTERPANAD